MAQHLPIQAKHHYQLKQHTRKQRTTAFPPGSAHTPPGETVPGASVVPVPLFPRHRLAELDVPPSVPQYSALSC